MPYINRLEVWNHYRLPNFAVDLPATSGRQFSDLILTGPNASGKTTLLDQLATEIRAYENKRPYLGYRHNHRQNPHGLARYHLAVEWNTLPAPQQALVYAAWQQRTFTSYYIPANRSLAVQSIVGPTVATDAGPQPPIAQLASNLEQVLVNLNVQAGLAKGEDASESDLYFDWLDRFEKAFSTLVGIKLKFQFNRKQFEIVVIEPGCAPYRLETMAAGYGSILRILSEMVLRTPLVDGLPAFFAQRPMEAVVLIDELDVHLHPKLQQQALPFLKDVMPNAQFIVATHSPAVVCSTDSAIVVDLANPHESIKSSSLRGTPYGQLMTGHFGLTTDLDLATTDALRELERLRDRAPRTALEQNNFEELASRLSSTSHPLALEVANMLLIDKARREAKGNDDQ